MYRRCFPKRTKLIELDFGTIPVGNTMIKSLKIVNESCKEQYYEVQRDPTTNPLDYAFNLPTYSWALAPEETHSCDIHYHPLLPFIENVDYFTIIDSSGMYLKITVRGRSIGPEVSPTVDTVILISTNEKPEAKKRIKLTNKSKVTATFMFDIDKNQETFKLDTTQGSIGSNTYKYITITFTPAEEGLNMYQLPCLVLYQTPVIIKLIGYCDKSNRLKDDLNDFIQSSIESNGFEGYLSDHIHVTGQKKPLLSLSNNYFDFGQVDIGSEHFVRRCPQVVCVTNHDEKSLSIKWNKDFRRVFTVSPKIAQIRSNQCALFEVCFEPDIRETVFVKELVGFIFYEKELRQPEDIPEIPLFTSVRVIGHSFPINSYGWIPQYEMPHTVIMPPCIPPYPVYNTFLIKKSGHLPLMFRFIPPPTSHFTVKPMLGIIYESFQVIAIKMLPEPEGENAYVERWAVRFNGNSKTESHVDFRGYAEYADVYFSDDGNVYFPPVHVCCQQTETVTMRNVTRHAITYEFRKVPSELKMQCKKGEIAPNDTLSHEWVFQPQKVRDYDFDIDCTLSIIQQGKFVGSKVHIPLHIYGRSEVGHLVATPDELEFGMQEYDTKVIKSFYVYNFSCVNIHFKMICVHRGWPLGSIENDVKIHPNLETVFAGSSERIDVAMTPHTAGYYQLLIQYFVRPSSREITPICREENPRNLCRVNCLCILPTLRVKYLHAYGPSKNTSTVSVWETMKINKLNSILNDITAHETRKMDIQLYPMPINEEPIIIKLLVTNPTHITTSWNFKRVQLCDCQPVPKPCKLSFRRMEYECIHKTVCDIYPKSGTLEPGHCTVITIEIRYVLTEKTTVRWDLDLGNERHILFDVTAETFSMSDKKISLLYGTELILENIYFGDKDPIYQVCWLHNSTNNNVPYSLDVTPFQKINNEYFSEIFTCETPRGIVEAQSVKPIILRFRPRQFGRIKTTVPLMLGDEKTEFVIEGDTCPIPLNEKIGATLIKLETIKVKGIPVFFNVDCVILSPISTHSRIIKLMMIYNNLENDAISYEFKSYNIPGILNVKFIPKKGLIQAKRVQTLRMIIESGGYPCKISVNVPCKLIDTSKRRDYQRSVLKRDILSKELEGQFDITEKGVTVPEPWLEVLKEPKPFYKVLNIQCYTYSPEDESMKITLVEEFKSTPSNEIIIEKEDLNNRKQEIMVEVASLILEGILWDIVNSRSFQTIISKILTTEPNLFYPQFTMDLYERKQLEKRSYILPPKRLLNMIFEKMIFIMVHEEFALGTTHLIYQADIRHTSYTKVQSGFDGIKTYNKQHDPHNLKSVEEKEVRKRAFSTATVSFEED